MRKPSSKLRETHLMAWWDDKEKDLVFNHPDFKANGHYLYWMFTKTHIRRDYDKPGIGKFFDMIAEDPSFIDELDRRGFDIKTLKFSIKKKGK